MEPVILGEIGACMHVLLLTLCVNVGSKLRKTPEIEEHTSELQSHSDLVCRLLLEKKKKKKIHKKKKNNIRPQ